MTGHLDVPETALRFGSGGVRRHATRHELRHARLEMERDLGVDVLLGERRAVDGEPKESAGAGRKHLDTLLRQVARDAAVRDAVVRMPLTISE